MGFVSFWIISTFIVFLVAVCIFYLDQWLTGGFFLELVEDIWGLVIVLLLTPFINLALLTVGLIAFLVAFIVFLADD